MQILHYFTGSLLNLLDRANKNKNKKIIFIEPKAKQVLFMYVLNTHAIG